MKEMFKREWFRLWFILTVSSSFVSFIGGLGYFFVLALLYPLTQLIAINRAHTSKLNYLWLLHFPFWIFVLRHDYSHREILIAITLNSILGEILLSIIFKRFGRLIWVLTSSLSYGLIYGGIQMYGPNDLVQIIVMI